MDVGMGLDVGMGMGMVVAALKVEGPGVDGGLDCVLFCVEEEAYAAALG